MKLEKVKFFTRYDWTTVHVFARSWNSIYYARCGVKTQNPTEIALSDVFKYKLCKRCKISQYLYKSKIY